MSRMLLSGDRALQAIKPHDVIPPMTAHQASGEPGGRAFALPYSANEDGGPPRPQQ